MSRPPALNVVVVAYGSPDLLDRCLTSLGEGLSVLIIDNSADQRIRVIAERHTARYVDGGGNIGFAAAVNRSLAALGSNHGDVLLLNPDAQVRGDVARALQTVLREVGNERIGCVSPALKRADGSVERVDWPFPSPWRAWLEAIGLGSLRRSAGFLIGAVLLIRSEAIDDVGNFDERFFLYAEETDWQRRAANAGWTSLEVTTLAALHDGAGTSSDNARREAMFHASTERYMRKWYGQSGWWIWRTGAVAGSCVRVITGPNRGRHRLRLATYVRGPERWERALGRPA